MKGLKSLTVGPFAVVLLATVLLASVPASAGAVAYKHYVGCGVSQKTPPSHSCTEKSKKGAFFKSVKADVNYTICVKFPTGKNLCADQQKALKGTLYVNKITSKIPGRHQVSWFVAGKRVGVFVFRVTE